MYIAVVPHIVLPQNLSFITFSLKISCDGAFYENVGRALNGKYILFPNHTVNRMHTAFIVSDEKWLS